MINDVSQINYSPDLEFKKNTYTNIQSINKSEIDYNDFYIDMSNASSCLNDFYNKSTHKTISKIINIINSIDYIKDTYNNSSDDILDKFYNDSTVNKNLFIDSNYENIHGSTRLELIIELNKIQTELNIIKDRLLYNIYGDNSLSLDEAKEIDYNECIKILNMENKGEYSKINYLSLHIESYINSIITIFLSNISEDVIGYANINDFSSSEYLDVINYHQIMLKNFNKISKKTKDSIFKDESSLYNIKVVVDNIFIYLQEYEDFLIQEEIVRLQYIDSDLFESIKDDYVVNISVGLDKLYKVLHQSISNKVNTFKLISQRNNIRKFFKYNGGVNAI